jgi:hypothetical protein
MAIVERLVACRWKDEVDQDISVFGRRPVPDRLREEIVSRYWRYYNDLACSAKSSCRRRHIIQYTRIEDYREPS